MIADLLELHQRRQDEPLPLHADGLLEIARRVVDDGAVERGLLPRQRAEDLHLVLLRQVRNDARIGFQPAEDERRGEPPELRDGVGIAPGLDGDEEALPERRLRAEEAGIEQIHDRPEVADVVLHRRAGEGDAERRLDRPRGLGLLRLGVLDVLRFVEDEALPRHALQRLDLAVQQRVARHDEGAALCRLHEVVAAHAVAAVVQHRRQRRREARGLANPVAGDRGRRDEKHRAAAG